MPDVSLLFPQLESLTPVELQNRRAALHKRMTTEFKGYDDPMLPEEILHELLCITRAIRRKTAGPPRAPKGATKPRVDATDMMDLI